LSNTENGSLPVHVGIIMDGNGRWANERKLSRSEGHREGVAVSKRIVKAARDAGIRFLSLYTFSTENWKRAREEVDYLMFLVKNHLVREFGFYKENRIRVLHSGDLAGLPEEIRKEIESVMRDTAGFDNLVLNLAINYGGRDEIVRAIQRLAEKNEFDFRGITAEKIASALDLPLLPDPDLIIRTAGDFRLSNFLLWESAYSELIFSPKFWPDFTESDFSLALQEYGRRERRFGGAK
jgi:undecaprenyl diphosphate synthase